MNSWAWNHFSQHLQHTIRTDAYDSMQEMELTFFDNRQTGEIMSVLNNVRESSVLASQPEASGFW